VRYCKKKTENESHPCGHSFEAVGQLRRRLFDKDPFLIYKVNNRNLNGEPSYVFKTSKIQAQLAVAMDRESNDFLSDEYCFLDRTFKRCPGFVTLGAHVYVDLLQKIVKIATMECESESTETMTIFWSLLNEVLETFTGKKGYKFNPVGWAVDEHGGNWASIRAVYGEEAVNARTVSCGFHFKQSIVRHAKHVGSAKSQTQFKVLANKLLSSVTVKNYDEAYLGLKNFIEKKPEKRGFLTSWLEWWNERKEHFANAFKPFGAAPVNLSEAYHSSYVTTGSKGLKLIDAAYKDVVIALCLERSLELFGQGIKCQGSGPSEKKRRKRDFTAQSQRAKEYAEVILDEELSDSMAQVWEISGSSSENDTDARRKRKRTSGRNEREQRYISYIQGVAK
jgi:hypothetical protein